MSNGDDEADASDDAEAADEIDVTAEELESRLTEASEDLDAAETEADLDDVESSLDDIENDLEAADLPEPDEDDDAEDPREELESQLSDLRDDLDAQRGPYAEDVVTIVSDAEDTVTDSEWTDDGEGEAQEAVETFLDESAEFVDHDADTGGDFVAAGDALTTVVDAIEAANLDLTRTRKLSKGSSKRRKRWKQGWTKPKSGTTSRYRSNSTPAASMIS